MGIINQIKEKLSKYPEVSFEENSDSITILASDPSRFDITLWHNSNEIVVYYEAWHEHFERSAEEDALNCLAFGLTNKCRLKVHRKGKKDYRWTLQYFDENFNDWIDDTTTFVFRLVPFWKKKEIRYLQNDIISIDAEQCNKL